MKALVYYGRRDVRLEDVPRPVPAEGEVLVRVTDAGLCQTQIDEFIEGPNFVNKDPHPLTGYKIPMIVGHEFGGVVEEIGPGVDASLTGKQVGVLPLLPCKECWYCEHGQENLCSDFAYVGLAGYPGGFAEYCVVPQDHVLEVEDKNLLSMIEPLLVAVHSHRMGRLQKDQHVLVMGAGAIGIAIAVYLAQVKGMQLDVCDIRPGRLERAAGCGLNVVPNSEISKQYDVVFDCAGQDPLAKETGFVESYNYLKRGGRLICIGAYFHNIDFLPIKYLAAELELIFSFAYTRRDVEELQRVLSKNSFDLSSVLSFIPLDDIIEEGYYRAEIDKDVFTRLVIMP